MTTASAAGTMLGRYQVLKPLARGGMAEVLLARAIGLKGFERHVVIKRIRVEKGSDQKSIDMFLDEARLAGSLHHRNIVQVHDVGEEEGKYFFVMEYVHGRDARELLRMVKDRKAQIPLEHVITIVTAAAAGLHYAHEQRGPDRQPLGIVHRDVSPGNILLAFDGGVKVVDFGIAKAHVRSADTQAGEMKGKVGYMSPEQCKAEPIDRRTDIFLLGIVLYELATVRRLFKYDTRYETMSAIVDREITPPSRFRKDLPAELEQIMLKALAKSPADRYPTADALRLALESFATRAGLTLSASRLSDYLKEQYGDVPEPWLVDERPPTPDPERLRRASQPSFAGAMPVSAPVEAPAVEPGALAASRSAAASSAVVAPAAQSDVAPAAPSAVAATQPSTESAVVASAAQSAVVATAAQSAVGATQPSTESAVVASAAPSVVAATQPSTESAVVASAPPTISAATAPGGVAPTPSTIAAPTAPGGVAPTTSTVVTATDPAPGGVAPTTSTAVTATDPAAGSAVVAATESAAAATRGAAPESAAEPASVAAAKPAAGSAIAVAPATALGATTQPAPSPRPGGEPVEPGGPDAAARTLAETRPVPASAPPASAPAAAPTSKRSSQPSAVAWPVDPSSERRRKAWLIALGIVAAGGIAFLATAFLGTNDASIAASPSAVAPAARTDAAVFEESVEAQPAATTQDAGMASAVVDGDTADPATASDVAGGPATAPAAASDAGILPSAGDAAAAQPAGDGGAVQPGAAVQETAKQPARKPAKRPRRPVRRTPAPPARPAETSEPPASSAPAAAPAEDAPAPPTGARTTPTSPPTGARTTPTSPPSDVRATPIDDGPPPLPVEAKPTTSQ